jgi:hypothetical protein
LQVHQRRLGAMVPKKNLDGWKKKFIVLRLDIAFLFDFSYIICKTFPLVCIIP